MRLPCINLEEGHHQKDPCHLVQECDLMRLKLNGHCHYVPKDKTVERDFPLRRKLKEEKVIQKTQHMVRCWLLCVLKHFWHT